MTIGAERPPYGAFQARFSPAGDQRPGRFFSREMPSRAGPRHSAQSPAAAGLTANTVSDKFKKMEAKLIIWISVTLCHEEIEIERLRAAKNLRRCNLKDVEY